MKTLHPKVSAHVCVDRKAARQNPLVAFGPPVIPRTIIALFYVRSIVLPFEKRQTDGLVGRTNSNVTNGPVLRDLLTTKVISSRVGTDLQDPPVIRSEEHTSELQSPMYLVCRLLLEKKKQTTNKYSSTPD